MHYTSNCNNPQHKICNFESVNKIKLEESLTGVRSVLNENKFFNDFVMYFL
jgi:hypothetical protein